MEQSQHLLAQRVVDRPEYECSFFNLEIFNLKTLLNFYNFHAVKILYKALFQNLSATTKKTGPHVVCKHRDWIV
jgi:hypothetical protein